MNYNIYGNGECFGMLQISHTTGTRSCSERRLSSLAGAPIEHQVSYLWLTHQWVSDWVEIVVFALTLKVKHRHSWNWYSGLLCCTVLMTCSASTLQARSHSVTSLLAPVALDSLCIELLCSTYRVRVMNQRPT